MHSIGVGKESVSSSVIRTERHLKFTMVIKRRHARLRKVV